VIVTHQGAAASHPSWVRGTSLQSPHPNCGQKAMGTSTRTEQHTSSWRLTNFNSQRKTKTWATLSDSPETQIHLQNFACECRDFFFSWYRYKIKVIKHPIHGTPDPKGRSIGRQSAALPANCKRSAKQKLHISTKTLEALPRKAVSTNLSP